MEGLAGRRRSLLTMLYGPEPAAAIAPQMDALLRRRQTKRPAGPHWTERDAWLITYADQFRRDGEAPIGTLADFLDTHIGNVINGVHVLPFYPWSSDDGFSVVDYLAVEPSYGTWPDLVRLASGRRLMVDAVINHMSAQSEWFRGFLAGDPRHAGFFRTADPAADLSEVVRPRTHPLLTEFPGKDGPVWTWTTFSADQVDLDYRTPELLLAVLEVLLRYVDHGATIIRLDAIGFLWKEEGTSSMHLPQTHAVIRFLRACLDEVAPDVLLVTESNVPHAENISYFGAAGEREAQAVYQFPLAPLMLHTVRTGSADVLAEWARSIELDRPDVTFLNFLASHDGVGVRPAEGLLSSAEVAGLVDWCRAAGGRIGQRTLGDGSSAPYELNSTWFDLMTVGVGEEIALARHLATHAVMFALCGIPLTYVHSLFGSGNDHAGFDRTGHNRTLNRERFDVDELSSRLGRPDSRAARVLSGLSQMLEWRASSAAFQPGARQRILATPPQALGILRTADNGAKAIVAVNFSTSPTQFDLPEGEWHRFGDAVTVSSAASLGPWETLWIEGAS